MNPQPIPEKAAELFTRGQAHLFIAVGKSDGFFSKLEKVRAGYFAQRGQKNIDFLNTAELFGPMTEAHINDIVHNELFLAWSANQHLDQALLDIKKAEELGIPDISALGLRLEKELNELALLEGYTMKESLFLKKIHARLAEL